MMLILKRTYIVEKFQRLENVKKTKDINILINM